MVSIRLKILVIDGPEDVHMSRLNDRAVGSSCEAPRPASDARAIVAKDTAAAGESAVRNRLSYILHDVNQSLAATLTSAEAALSWLTRDPQNHDDIRAAIECTVRNCHRATDMLRGFEHSVGAEIPIFASFDINDLIQEQIALLSFELRARSVLVETDFTDGLEPVSGDCDQLRRALGNLITNSLEALSAVHGRTRKLWLRTRRGVDRDVIVDIEDTGAGIALKNVDRIFHPSFSTKREGGGLGLAICRSIIEFHGGRLWVTPKRPYGTIFHVSLPNNHMSAHGGTKRSLPAAI